MALDAALIQNIYNYYLPISVARTSNSYIVPSVKVQKQALVDIHQEIGVPVQIKIPSIAVDAAVEETAIAADGSMGVPTHPLDAAWYSLGPRPGEIGSAAISGHVNWKYGATAVFANLAKLKIGDKIYIKDDKGATSTFVVRFLRTYGSNDAASEVFLSNDGKARLNLITCIGIWEKKLKSYSRRLVVFTEAVL